MQNVLYKCSVQMISSKSVFRQHAVQNNARPHDMEIVEAMVAGYDGSAWPVEEAVIIEILTLENILKEAPEILIARVFCEFQAPAILQI